jgi:drug/metabolite transporter (DMT)-like permease
MSHDILVAILAGLCGMMGWGLADFFAKKTIDAIGDIVSLVWAHIAGSAVVILLILGSAVLRDHGLALPETLADCALLAFFGALQAAVYLFVYIGFGKGQVSVLNPVFACFSGVVAVVSITFLGEATTGLRVAALAILFVGILLLSVDIEALRVFRLKFARVPGFREIAIATVLATFWTLGWNRVVKAEDGPASACWMYLFMTLALVGYAFVRSIPVRFAKPSVWRALFLIGICEVVAYVAITIGYAQTTHTSVVALLSGAFSLPTILLARVVLRERVTTVQTVGSLVIVAGIALLAIG